MTALTIILVMAAVASFLVGVICAAFAIKGLVKIAHQSAPERFSSAGAPPFSLSQLHDLSTYLAAFRLLLSAPAMRVPDSSCRRCLVAFRLCLYACVVFVVWLTLQ